MSMQWLISLMRLAGDKLPQVWPHIQTIGVAVAQIVAILGFQAKMKAVTTSDLVDCPPLAGIPEDEVKVVVAPFKALDDAL